MRGCGAVQFVQFSYYKIANCTASCSAVRYHYAILWAVLVRFGEHPYLLYMQVRLSKLCNRICDRSNSTFK